MNIDKSIIDLLVKKLIELKEDARYNIACRVKDSSAYKEVESIPENELPLHINDHDPDSPKHFLISCRLSGDDPFEKDLCKCVEILYDVEFNMDSYREIGYNDGLATSVSMLLDIVGMEKEANQAREAIYSCD